MNIIPMTLGGVFRQFNGIMGRMQCQGAGRGKRMSQGKRGEGRVNHDTAPSTKGITRMKVRHARPAY
jgi:hypothetical protein